MPMARDGRHGSATARDGRTTARDWHGSQGGEWSWKREDSWWSSGCWEGEADAPAEAKHRKAPNWNKKKKKKAHGQHDSDEGPHPPPERLARGRLPAQQRRSDQLHRESSGSPPPAKAFPRIQRVPQAPAEPPSKRARAERAVHALVEDTQLFGGIDAAAADGTCSSAIARLDASHARLPRPALDLASPPRRSRQRISDASDDQVNAAAAATEEEEEDCVAPDGVKEEEQTGLGEVKAEEETADLDAEVCSPVSSKPASELAEDDSAFLAVKNQFVERKRKADDDGDMTCVDFAHLEWARDTLEQLLLHIPQEAKEIRAGTRKRISPDSMEALAGLRDLMAVLAADAMAQGETAVPDWLSEAGAAFFKRVAPLEDAAEDESVKAEETA